MAFQRQPVRASIRCYPDFTLPMDRSLGFASNAIDSTHKCAFISREMKLALFRLAFATAPSLMGINLANDINS